MERSPNNPAWVVLFASVLGSIICTTAFVVAIYYAMPAEDSDLTALFLRTFSVYSFLAAALFGGLIFFPLTFFCLKDKQLGKSFALVTVITTIITFVVTFIIPHWGILAGPITAAITLLFCKFKEQS